MWNKPIRLANRVLEWFLIFLMTANVINVLWQVFTRFVLKDSSSFTEELARFLLIWVGLLGASYAAGKKMHLAIEVFQEKLQGKALIWVEIGIQVFIFLFALLAMVYGGLRLVFITLKLNQVSAALQIPLGYVYLVLPMSGFLIMLYTLAFMWEKREALRK